MLIPKERIEMLSICIKDNLGRLGSFVSILIELTSNIAAKYIDSGAISFQGLDKFLRYGVSSRPQNLFSRSGTPAKISKIAGTNEKIN